MPHKQAVCIYCHAPMEIGRVHPSMSPYHGSCRLEVLRERWPKATTQLDRDIMQAEADAIKNHMKDMEP